MSRLKVVIRKDTGALTISGTVAGQHIRKRAQSDDRRLAEEEANAIETGILRTAWHGERRGARPFSEAVISYIEGQPRRDGTRRFLNRLLRVLGEIPLADIDQNTIARARRAMLLPDALPSTVSRSIIVPIRAVMMHAHALGWCDAPRFKSPRQPQGRIFYLLPAEARRLIEAAAPHLRPLLLMLIGTGARASEALELDWRDVDLRGARAILWRTKNGRRRDVLLPPVVVAALANQPHREGAVFRRPDGKPYRDKKRESGGQITDGFAGAVRRAGLNPALTPHDLRHTYASWHYATNRDLLALKHAGGWSSSALVERYAHLMPAGLEDEIKEFFGHNADSDRRSANVG